MRWPTMGGIRRVLAGLVLVILAPAVALGQMGPEDDWADPNHGELADEGASSLDEARGSGRSVRLGGSLGARTIPEVYVVRRGDTLWDITGRFYGNPWQWPKVWSYNPEVTNPHWIYPDDPLRLLPEGEGRASVLPDTPELAMREGRAAPRSVYLREEGFLDADALEAAGEIVGSPEEHMLLAPFDDVYVRFAEGADVRRGMQLTVFRRMEASERGEEEEGVLVRIFGTVEVRSYDAERNLARATITEALDPIERGYRVADVPRSFEMVEPVTNEVDVEAEVVAALRPLRLMGDYQIVFVDAGAEQGVRRGNRFFIVRRGDEWRENLAGTPRDMGATVTDSETLDDYPEEIVAEGRVVNVRPDTAALMVTRSTMPVEIGDQAEMRAGY